ncbi:MAG: hypothetical protein ACK2U3_07095 [Anaerolineales bacterium]|jgi:protein-tyrosine phosphatase
MGPNNTPSDISQITDQLFISSWPEGEHYQEILELNIRLILSMHWMRPSKSLEQPPVKLLWLWTVDTPLTPLPMSKLRRGVEAALPVIRDGYGVLSHCRAGIHRGAAMACCVLIGLGYSASEAIRLVESKRQIADPGIWYIRRRIEKFERVWKHHPVI